MAGFEDPLTSRRRCGRRRCCVRARARRRLARRRRAAAAGARRVRGAVGGARVHGLQGRASCATDPAHRTLFFASLLGRPRRVRLGAAPAPDGAAARRAVRGRRVDHGAGRRRRSQYALVEPRTPASPTRRAAADRRQPRRTPRSPPRATSASAFEQFDPRLTDAIGRRDGARLPRSTPALVWSHGLRWRPLPIFQAYSAYTAGRSTGATPTWCARPPGRTSILREATTQRSTAATPRSSRPRRWSRCSAASAPAARPLGRWLLLAREAPIAAAASARSRRSRATARRAGDVPPAPDANPRSCSCASTASRSSGLEKLRTALYRALVRQVTFDGGRRQRLVPGHRGDGLSCASRARADYPDPVRARPALRTRSPWTVLGRSGGDLRLRFSSMPIR